MDEFTAGPRDYIKNYTPPSGWKKISYRKFYMALREFLKSLPTVQLDDEELVFTTIKVGAERGLDWVDCLLIARYIVYGAGILSIDEPLQKTFCTYQWSDVADANSSVLSKMSLDDGQK